MRRFVDEKINRFSHTDPPNFANNTCIVHICTVYNFVMQKWAKKASCIFARRAVGPECAFQVGKPHISGRFLRKAARRCYSKRESS